jgi:hypothetical protein
LAMSANIKVLIMQFSPASCNFLSLRSICSLVCNIVSSCQFAYVCDRVCKNRLQVCKFGIRTLARINCFIRSDEQLIIRHK